MPWMGFSGYVKHKHKIQNDLVGLDLFCMEREEAVEDAGGEMITASQSRAL